MIDDAWTDDARNPFNWPEHKKWRVVLISCVATALVGLNSTVTTTLTTPLADEFNVANGEFEYVYFLVTAWNSAAALIPLATLPLMEAYGMRPGYLASFLLFVVFLVPQAVARNFATLVVTRVVAGAAGGTVQNAIDGVIANLWRDERARALPLAVFVFALLAGVTLGPVQGAVMGPLGWRWAVWIEVIGCGAWAPVVWWGVVETRGEVVRGVVEKGDAGMAKDVGPVGKEHGAAERHAHEPSLSETVGTIAQVTGQAVVMLFTSPVLASFTLLSAFSFGLVFAAADSVPLVMAATFGLDDVAGGLMQTALFTGEVLGLGLTLLQNRLYVRSGTPGPPVPETILHASVAAIPALLAGGLFVYGFTAQYAAQPHWAVPAVGLAMQGAAVQVVVAAVSIYITDFFPARAASAIAAVAAGENVMAALLPLGIRPLYVRLGFGWASGLLGFVGLALGAAPAVLVWRGRAMRLAA